jgi:hypothetical protein
MQTKTSEFGHTKLFQNEEQKTLFGSMKSIGSVSVVELIKSKNVKKIVTDSARGADNSARAMKVRLRGRIRVLKNRLEARGSSLPV